MDKLYLHSMRFAGTWIHWLALTVLVLVFVLLKWSSLSLPFFWDEAWSYIPAIVAMESAGPCFWPGCIDPDLYRGHPLFFYFISSAWMKLAGGSLFSMHAFMLCLACLTVRMCYLLSLEVMPATMALITAGVLIMQQAFFVQASYVLPEMLLGLLLLSALLHYSKGNRWYCVIYLSLLVMTKEIGLLIAFVFAVFHVVTQQGSFKRPYWLAIPLLLGTVFYVSQKIRFGWYFYPLHIDLAGVSLSSLYSKANIIFSFLFVDQGRFFVSLGALSAISYFLWAQKKASIVIVLISLSLIISTTLYISIAWGALMGLAYLFYGVRQFKSTAGVESAVLPLMLILLLSGVLFSSANFLMLRYVLYILPLVLILTMYILHNTIEHKVFMIILITGMVSAFTYSFYNNRQYKSWHDDVSINYLNMVGVHQEVVAYCETRQWQSKQIQTHFLLAQNLTNSDLGYLKDSVEFRDVTYSVEDGATPAVILFSAIEFDEQYYERVKNDSTYHLEKRFQCKKAWSEIFVRTDHE
jgi:hypothetical protein